jgi:hypothetical protein
VTDLDSTEKLEIVKRYFFPYATRMLESAKKKSMRFAHYTSAHAAIEIIRNQSVWLRRSSLMNDYSEIQHGEECLRTVWHDENLGTRFKAVLNRCRDGLAEQFAKAWDERQVDRNTETFMLSISEHGDDRGNEDKYGRLSMWRAYGGNTNVAIVMNNRPFMTESNALNAYTSPVLYSDKEGFKKEFAMLLKGLENGFEQIKPLGADAILESVFTAFHFAAVSTKHPGFLEEREWRVIYSPSLFPSKRIKDDIEVINGIPQRVCKLKLENYPDEGFEGATLPEILDEIIIGPTAHPYPIYDALVSELQKANVEDAENKVKVSNIPLRR